jgi:uncharacterized protein YqeY
MSLSERISQEIKAATLARDANRLNTLRLLKSAIGYTQIERKNENLSDAEVMAVVRKEISKRRDSIEQFKNGNRPELAQKEKEEMAILETLLPQQMAPEELEQLVRATIQELNATSKKDMGRVIKAVQEKAAGRADGKVVSGLVGKLLP